MTTAHRPTFDPARGKAPERGASYNQRFLPAHLQLKTRQPGQGGSADTQHRDLRAELLKAEAAHFSKTKGSAQDQPETSVPNKRQLEGPGDNEEEEDYETKRQRVLEESRDIDADSDGAEDSESSDDSDDDDEDETAELMRELQKIKKERAEQREQEEKEKAAEDEAKREIDIARGNPLLNPAAAASQRRWDDDVVFKNQARGTENKQKKEFVNDLLRSDFHKRFMSKYVR